VASSSTRPSLLERLRDPRDEAAWREFDEQYRELLMRYCVRSGLNAADGDDICQIVFAALVRTMPTFRFDPARGRFRSYLGRMVTNAILQQRARGSAPASLDRAVLELLAAPEVALETTWEEEWTNHHLRRALATLRRQTQPGTMEAFERLLAGKSVAEVAQELHMTTDGVHKIKQRIGERLREEVERQVREEDPVEESPKGDPP
jgi:RNA polymerase sigma-70 factor (ECF subfamily)